MDAADEPLVRDEALGVLARLDGARVDLVYNRLTDFMLAGENCTALREAYAAGAVVVTPNPHVYALYADKRHLAVLSDAQRLRDWGVAEADIATLLDDSRRPVDRDVFARELAYYQIKAEAK